MPFFVLCMPYAVTVEMLRLSLDRRPADSQDFLSLEVMVSACDTQGIYCFRKTTCKRHL